MTVYTYDQLLGFAQGAGFSGQSANTIAAIALAESSGNDQAVNSSDPNGGSFGLTQINGVHPGAINTLGNPAEAFAQAFNISGGGTNFSPWSTYTSGAYAQYLGGGSGLSGLGGILASNGSSPIFGSSGGSGSTGSLTGTSATGQTNTAQSPLSAIFEAVGNLFQSAGLLLLGAVLVGVGAWYIAKPKEG